ncbi:pilus assembly protein [Paenibacillus thiaminolyticus]|uniref:TadE/TadG family type IV pilus assembly protein n=1 Tax=Paenibacillus thiaminolyticus TaxID=49283 RepID=UPI001F0F29C2|nr:TadE family protein [Paenibacillus thiaminolyticus]WCR26752.1 pilus assembly protein [Paenibacillus thiaminolyticus]
MPYRSLFGDWRGSITVEAALLLPMVLLVFMFFVFMIQAAVIATSLQSAAMNAVKQVSAHLYPVSLLAVQSVGEDGDRSGKPDKWLPPAQRMKMTVQEFGRSFGSELPQPVSEWVEDGTEWAARQAEAAGEWGQARLAKMVIKPLLVRYGVQGVLREERLRVTHVKFPDLDKKTDPYFAIEVAYDLPMRVPFLNTTLTLSARAMERVWVGDGPAPSDSGNDLANKPAPALVELTPEPLLPGRKARLIAKVEPNERVELIVYYKSGKSQAKHVGWATADADGLVKWEWHVSGNTTSGTWRLAVKTEDGRSAERAFEVK